MRRPALLASAAALLLSAAGPAAAQQCLAADASPPAPARTATPPPARVSVPAQAPLPAAIPKPRIGPDEAAALPALAKLLAGGAELYDLGARHGLRGVFAVAREQNQFRVYYLTPDGEGLIEGKMVSTTVPSDTREVTAAQVRDIPGVLPTVDLRGSPAPAAAARAAEDGEAALAAIEAAAHGTVGRDGAPRVWMAFDPLCPFSAAALEKLRPAIDAGRLQLALVPAPMLDPDGTKPNTPAALALLSLPAGAPMDAAWATMAADARARRPMPAPADFGPDARAALNANRAIVRRIWVRSSPTFLWRAPDTGAPSADMGTPGTERIAAAFAAR